MRELARLATPFSIASIFLVSITPVSRLVAETDVFEVGPADTEELPGGKEADGIIGDFVIRNDRIEAVIGGNLPGRKANMGVNWDHPTPGCLYDLCVRGSGNDQLTYLGPGGLEGRVTTVRVVTASETALGVPGVRSERSAATGEGHAERHDYLLGPGWDVLAIHSRYHNATSEDWELNPVASWKEFHNRKTVRGIFTGDAPNPADRQGYAMATSPWSKEEAGVDLRRLAAPASRLVLAPGTTREFLTLVAPGRSQAEAYGRIARFRGPTGVLRVNLSERERPVSTARLEILMERGDARSKDPIAKKDRWIHAYPDSRGAIELRLPPGAFPLRIVDLGRPLEERSATIRSGELTELSHDYPSPPSRIEVRVRDRSGAAIPAKVRFLGLGDTKAPYFGVEIQARGCRNVYQSERGHFTQPIDPGAYRLVVTRGIEYDHATHDVVVRPGETVLVESRLTRLVKTPGWVSTDFHNHSTPSGDNYCGTMDRVINLAVEQVEFAPTTEHNRLNNWEPWIRSLGLENEIKTIVGLELTGPNAHFNAFPYEVKPFRQDGGAPTWQHDPRINAIVLRDHQGSDPHRWVQLNHPDVGKFFRDRNADGIADGGYPGLEFLIDGAETWSEEILNPSPRLTRIRDGKEQIYANRTFAWLQLLNQGVHMNCVAVSDAHAVWGNAVGGWRTYVPSSTDEPLKISPEEIVRHSKAGRMFVTTGPFLEVKLSDGTGIGGRTVIEGPFFLEVRVQCTDWIEIDRVQVLLNGRQPEELDFTRRKRPELFREGVVRFEHRIPLELHEDAHLIVAAVGEGHDLEVGYGNAYMGGWKPCAFSNPIYVDIDGHGFTPNGDTLGAPLPLGK